MGERLDRWEGARASLHLASDSPERTIEIGRRIGSLVPPGSILSLEGGLGAGKTLLAKGICAGLGVAETVLSPSFILVEEYRGELPVFHVDLYRLERVDEAAGIGLFDAADGRAIVIVEWGDRLPPGALDVDCRISMTITGEWSRALAIEAPEILVDRLGEGSA